MGNVAVLFFLLNLALVAAVAAAEVVINMTNFLVMRATIMNLRTLSVLRLEIFRVPHLHESPAPNCVGIANLSTKNEMVLCHVGSVRGLGF